MAEIKVQGDTSYVKSVLAAIQTIKGQLIGQIIAKAIEGTGKQLKIKPESERPKQSFDPNRSYTGSVAATFPVDSSDKPNYAAASPANLSRDAKGEHGKWYAGKADNPDTDADERLETAPKSWGAAKGGGSDVDIYFTPGGGDDEACSKGSGLCADLPDEILLHEMVHALRMMQGVFNPVPTTGRYKNEEEFLALVIANVYISKKKGNKLLRPDYQLRYGPMKSPLNTSDGFLKDDENKRILEYYASAWQPIFGQLGAVDTDFNPFRPFNKTAQKAKPANK